MDTSLLFSYKIETVKYAGSIYRGTLSELIEVCLTHVYQFLESDDLASIEQIHDFAIIELGPKITAERVETVLQVFDVNESIKYSSLILFIIQVSTTFIFVACFVIFAQKKKKDLNAFLETVLSISENEIRRLLQECEKFSNAISSLFKNYDIDLQNVGSKKEEMAKRIKPKQTNFGFSSIIIEVLFVVYLAFSFLGLNYYLYQKTVGDC